jgi:hypothetical protein
MNNELRELTFISFAIDTYLIAFEFQQTFDGLCVLRSAVCLRISSARHDPSMSRKSVYVDVQVISDLVSRFQKVVVGGFEC